MWKVKKRHMLLGSLYLILFFYFTVSFIFIIHYFIKDLTKFYPLVELALLFPLLITVHSLIERGLIAPFLKQGNHDQQSLQGFLFGMHVLFSSFFIYPIQFYFPIQLKKYIYKMNGAKIGKGTKVGSIMGEPFLVEIGENCIISNNTGIVAHTLYGKKLILENIKIGHNVIVNDYSIIFSGVIIGDNSQIRGKSIVKRGTIIPSNQVWGGIPAKFISKIK
ncbi:hypothetical protein J4408_02085 [Candidatus Pacearchaeota archaeon]|nr:hypothetical protein [Candidatus Pacearchaeota archaeon]